MARNRVSVDGLANALRAVGRIPEGMRQARAETLNEWATTVQDGAEERVPRRTGALWESIDARVDERYGRAEVGVWDEKELEYAVYVEKGTSSMAEQPYLEPAFDVARPRVIPTYRAAFARHVRGQ